jgi:hypothetical protein
MAGRGRGLKYPFTANMTSRPESLKGYMMDDNIEQIKNLISYLEVIIEIQERGGLFPHFDIEKMSSKTRRDIQWKREIRISFWHWFGDKEIIQLNETLSSLEHSREDAIQSYGEESEEVGKIDYDIGSLSAEIYHKESHKLNLLIDLTKSLILDLKLEPRYEDLEYLSYDNLMYGKSDLGRIRVVLNRAINKETLLSGVTASENARKHSSSIENFLNGNWSMTMSKAEMMTRLKMTPKKFKTFSEHVGIKKFGRQLFSIHLDNCTPQQRQLIEHGRPKT